MVFECENGLNPLIYSIIYANRAKKHAHCSLIYIKREKEIKKDSCCCFYYYYYDNNDDDSRSSRSFCRFSLGFHQ